MCLVSVLDQGMRQTVPLVLWIPPEASRTACAVRLAPARMTARGAVSSQSGSPPRCHSGCQKERGQGAYINLRAVIPVTPADGCGD